MDELLRVSLNAQVKRLEDQVSELLSFASAIDEVETRTFKFVRSDLADGVKRQKLFAEFPRKGRWIYVLTTNQPAEFYSCYKSKDIEERKNLKLPKYNGFINSKTLYVGSSNSLNKRLEQHCGFGHRGTYSLKLKEFNCSDNIEFELKCFKVLTDHQTVLQNIEDGMWHELKPMFGKQGSNNKSVTF